MRRLLLGLVVAVATLVPNLATANDQAIARHIMSKLQMEQQRGALRGFHVDMRVDKGTVWYNGFVANQQQKTLILRTAQQAKNLGVVQVVDDITVRNVQQTRQTSYAQANANGQLAQTAYQADVSASNYARQQPRVNIPSPSYANARATVPAQNVGAPMPMARSASAPMPTSGDSASLPGYAWPTYAAHPNYGAVTYPRQYSASAWPYIGPFYPYPQVPLGWRKVTMEWDDGWWWLDFHSR